MVLAICDCGEESEITRILTEKMRGGIERMYFRCQHCGKEYLVCYTDKEIRKKQKKLQKGMHPLLAKKLGKDIAADMAELKMRVEGT